MLSLFYLPVCVAQAMTRDEQERWLDEDEEFSVDQVNTGKLEFLSEIPAAPVLHSVNVLTVNRDSIEHGWVSLEQCYRQLDPVPDAEVVYRYRSMRNLSITHTLNIGAAAASGQSVQLTDVGRDAGLCISAEVRIFYPNPDGTYRLVNGPFLRKFLDGYYPFHLTLTVRYPSSLLEPVQVKPEAQAGFVVEQSAGTILVDSYFDGILNMEIIFQRSVSRP